MYIMREEKDVINTENAVIFLLFFSDFLAKFLKGLSLKVVSQGKE
jgi:hypothetical protein